MGFEEENATSNICLHFWSAWTVVVADIFLVNYCAAENVLQGFNGKAIQRNRIVLTSCGLSASVR